MFKDVETLYQSIKEYFKKYVFIEVNLNNVILDESNLKYTITIRSTREYASIETSFKIDEDHNLRDLENNIIDFSDIWRYLYNESMKCYDLAMKRLLKMEN